MTARRRILVVAPWVPAPTSGFGTRVHQLCAGLADQHSVQLLCHARPDDARDVAVLRERLDAVHTVPAPASSRLRKRLRQAASLVTPRPFESRLRTSPGLRAALEAVLAAEAFDIVQIESAHLGDLTAPGLPVVLDEHNIEHEILERVAAADHHPVRRAFHRWDGTRMRRFERHVWSRVDACALTSEREEALLRRVHPDALTAVVPNGVDTAYFRRAGGAPEAAPSTVFVGTMHYRPNVDGARHFIEETLPLLWRDHPDLTFTAVGHSAPAELTRLATARVRVTGFVPDVRPHLERATVVVVPLRSGSGTRLKILDALSMGCAVVTTRLGMEGIDAVDGEHLLVADDPGPFAAAVARLLDDAMLRHRLGAQGRELVVRRYGWRASVEALDDLQSRALARGVRSETSPGRRSDAAAPPGCAGTIPGPGGTP